MLNNFIANITIATCAKFEAKFTTPFNKPHWSLYPSESGPIRTIPTTRLSMAVIATYRDMFLPNLASAVLIMLVIPPLYVMNVFVDQ